ncbi:TPA: hypothetical protein N0F65_007068 [Lagenidium giganteum]|uniref:Calcium-activated potassium channel n=1 Tax=Lagenidium giganteum TaxID=4803 RepID=A0AAV2YU92_9STRA|nr:TPA: hypothetical protein N0F65_007068 [Lagenidium giganteum]
MRRLSIYLQYKKCTPELLSHRLAQRLHRSVKRRMKGESYRQWLDRNLKDSEAGVAFDVYQSVISIVMVRSVIEQNWDKPTYVRSASYRSVDVLNLVAIGLSFILRFYAASNRKAFCLHWLSLIDISCLIPLFVETISSSAEDAQNKYLFRFLLMVRTLRILQLYRLVRLAKSAKTRQGVLIGLTSFCIIICAAATFQTIEYCDPTSTTMIKGKTCQDLSFFDSLYFVCITVGTVGYGEFAPKTKVGKVVDIALIVFTGTLIPILISGYTDILSRETAFDKRYIPDKNIQHILLCGDMENGALRFFLHNWLYVDGERGNRRRVILLSPTLPSNSLRRLLIHREYEQRVLYLQGSAMVAADLLRAGAPSAAYCFIMVKKHSETLDQNDTATNLLTCSVRKNNRQAPLYVQVSKFDNVRHINISGASAVVCLERLKLSLLAKSMWMKGLNAFMGNLLQRIGTAEDTTGFWMSEYLAGCGQRIFEAVIPTCLFCLPNFRALALLIYREVSAPVVGIRAIDETVLVYPIDKELHEIPFVSVFFIGKGIETALKIERLNATILVRHTDIAPNIGLGGRSHRSVTDIFTTMNSVVKEVKNFPGRTASVAVTNDSVSRMLTAQRLEKIVPLHNNKADYGDSESFLETQQAHQQSSPTTKDSSECSNDLSPINERLPDVTAAVDSAEPALVSHVNDASHQGQRNSSYAIAEAGLQATEIVNKAGPPATLLPHSPVEESTSHESNTNNANDVSLSPTSPMRIYGEPIRVMGVRHSSMHAAADHPDRSSEEDIKLSNRPPVLHRNSVSGGSYRMSYNPRTHRTSVFRSFRRSPPPADMSGHFVVCGIPSSYGDFLASLCDLHEPIPPVVFVTPHELSEKDFQMYVHHTQIYFVRGSPVTSQAFHNARMMQAKAIVILSYCGSNVNEENRTEPEVLDEYMADVDAITTHRFISESCQNSVTRSRFTIAPKANIPFIVVEMMRPSNVKFLVDRSGALYDEHAMENQFRARELLRDVKCLDESLFSPLYVAGHVYYSNLWDALNGCCANHPFLIEMITALVTGGNPSLGGTDNEARTLTRLTQIPAPSKFHHRPYGTMVEDMMLHDATVVLGIFHTAQSYVSPSFVITNPRPEFIVTPHDLLFVIQ